MDFLIDYLSNYFAPQVDCNYDINIAEVRISALHSDLVLLNINDMESSSLLTTGSIYRKIVIPKTIKAMAKDNHYFVLMREKSVLIWSMAERVQFATL